MALNIRPDSAPMETQRVREDGAEQQQTDGPVGSTDAEILRKAAAGDQRAFHDLVDRHAQRLFRLAVSLVGNVTDAEDVLQETFAGVFGGMKRFEGRASVKTWMTRILVIQAAKCRRDRKGRSRKMSAAESVAQSAATHNDVTSPGVVIDGRIDLQAALRQLTVEHREVLVLREFEHLTYEEMAEALGLPRGTIESRLHRARSELREKLRVYGF